jgi:hypothetical protein
MRNARRRKIGDSGIGGPQGYKGNLSPTEPARSWTVNVVIEKLSA